MSLQAALIALANAQQKNTEFQNAKHLVQIVNAIRPSKFMVGRREELARQRVEQLLELLRGNEEYRIALRTTILSLLQQANHIPLYTESGLLSHKGFFSEGFRKIIHLVLPPLLQPESLKDLVNMVFHEQTDYTWLQAVPDELFSELLRTLEIAAVHHEHTPAERHTYTQLLNAIVIVSHKIAAMGLEPDIIGRLPEFGDMNSPFMEQHREITAFMDILRHSTTRPTPDNIEHKHALVMLSQCEECIQYLRRRSHREGASLGLTYQMQRIMQHIQRLRTLLSLTVEEKSTTAGRNVAQFLKEVVVAENQRHNLRKLVNDNVDLLALQVAENAAKTGEHYITSTRSEYKQMLRSALGGGFIVAFLACLKLFFGYRHFPPLIEAFAYSINYAAGFVTIHILGFTLATKQPAMTASRIAESLDTKQPGGISLENLVVMISRIARSQFISFVGNLSLVFPTAYLLAWLYVLITGTPIADEHKAQKMLAELHPFLSLALIHAGIAGVFLFTAGLISGYYDNKVVFAHIPERIKAHPVLRRVLAPHVLERFANYVENNLGALAGNTILGFFLGTAGTIGFLFGLPIDIRHITFAAGNFALAVVSLQHHVTLAEVLWTVFGIIGIGAMNFLVSFSLALLVAIKSRRVNFRQTARLLHLLSISFKTHTAEFFFPPKHAEEETETSSHH